MNILLTCAGRRNYLIQYFKEALGAEGFVCAADASPDAPALQEADRAFVVPPISDPGYFDLIFDICQKNQIRLLISLNDLELPYLANNRSRFTDIGVLPVISSPAVIDICFDKWRTVDFLTQNGIGAPKTYLLLKDALEAISKRELSFPLVVKPRWGSASIGIEYPENLEELELVYRLVRMHLKRSILASVSESNMEQAVLIQEKLIGQEYGLDVVNDLNGSYVNTYVKRKLAMRAGETDRALTVQNNSLVAVGEKIGNTLKHIGNLDCDVFETENGAYVLEMNPRFGGGYPFTHAAGVNLPAALIAWVNGAEANPKWFQIKYNISAAKCDRVVLRKI
ncbi:MAG TPA: ATP-grasp domain-containing protein [Bacillota bacterium]|nr:ATP-grasp domain-containing protein [Bacillota bacterium]